MPSSCWPKRPIRPGREADPRAGHRGAQARPPLPHHGPDRCDPGRAARRAARPAASADRRLRRHRRSLIAVIITFNQQVNILQEQVREHFRRHPDAEIYRSQPGLGAILGARVLSEFGDDPHRYPDAKSRNNYAATSPLTRASGKKKIITARFIHNDRLIDALHVLGLLLPERIPRRPRLLRPAPRPRNRTQRRPPPPRQPARRHPPRMPQDPHPLRRGHRLGPPRKSPSIFGRGLTFKLLGYLSCPTPVPGSSCPLGRPPRLAGQPGPGTSPGRPGPGRRLCHPRPDPAPWRWERTVLGIKVGQSQGWAAGASFRWLTARFARSDHGIALVRHWSLAVAFDGVLQIACRGLHHGDR